MSAHVELVILRHEVAELRRKLAEATAELGVLRAALCAADDLMDSDDTTGARYFRTQHAAALNAALKAKP
jgi:hypothetical protein